MQERIRRPIAVFVVSVLLGALAAGAALTVNINGTPGDDMAGGGRVPGTIEEIAMTASLDNGTRTVGDIEE